MELIDRLNALSERARQVRETIETEEATKNALILPFLSALGYDVFDPAEVNPEFTADVGVRKHEKVDYAICIDGEPVMLVECKNCGAGLDGYSSQLFRYFSVTPARIAILTDGIAYRFYSDLAEPNKLDSEPFLTVSVEELRSQDVKQLERFQRGTFDTSSILEAAEELRYSHAIRTHFARELEEPTSCSATSSSRSTAAGSPATSSTASARS